MIVRKLILSLILFAAPAAAQWPTPTPLPYQIAQEYNIGFAPRGPSPSPTATPTATPPAAWTDTFTRADLEDDIVTNCDAEGPADECDWEVPQGEVDIASNELDMTGDGANEYVVSGTDTTTLAQYSGANYTGTVTGSYAGVSVRGTGGTGSGDCHYIFRHDTTNADYYLRACASVSSTCGDIEQIADSGGGGTLNAFNSGDGLGISVDNQTGDNVIFTVYHFDGVPVPADFADWDANSDSFTICDNDGEPDNCDKVWTALPSAGNGCNADNYRVGLYNGGGNQALWDNWSGGDTD